MTGDLDLIDVYAHLRKSVGACGSQRLFAERHRLPESVVSDVLYARRDPGPNLLAALGLRKVVVYRPLGRKDATP